jgi:hypothetical protein
VVQILDWYFCTRPSIEAMMKEVENRHRRREAVSKSKLEKSRREPPSFCNVIELSKDFNPAALLSDEILRISLVTCLGYC